MSAATVSGRLLELFEAPACEVQRCLAVNSRWYLAAARSGTDEQGLAGGFDDLGRHDGEVVELLDPVGLGEQPGDEAEVAAGDAGDGGDRDGLGEVVVRAWPAAAARLSGFQRRVSTALSSSGLRDLLTRIGGATSTAEQPGAQFDRDVTPAADPQPERPSLTWAAAAPSTPEARRPPGKAQRAILTVLAQRGVQTAQQVALLAGYTANGGGFTNAVSALRTAGLHHRRQGRSDHQRRRP